MERRYNRQAGLERERRARERQEKEQLQTPAERGKRISTLHREADFTIECPERRISPVEAPGQLTTSTSAKLMKKSNTDVSVCYRPSRGNQNPASASAGEGRNEGRGERQSQELVRESEFDRRLQNAKRLGKAPMPSVCRIPWYHPGVSRHIAESILIHPDISDGTYLMRDSTNSTDSVTLSVRGRTAIRHYRLQWDGKYFCFGLGKFSDVESLEEHFRQQPMISGDSTVLVKLCCPYPREVVEPHDYQEATEVSAIVMDTVELSTTHSLAINSKEGFLTKLGYHRKNWKIRWFTLYRNELKYFNTKDDKTPLRVINLDEARGVERDDTMGKPNCFRLEMPYRTFFMVACSNGEAEDWVKFLRWRLESNSR